MKIKILFVVMFLLIITQYAAFGKVIEGLDVVDRIACVDTDYGDMPLTPVVMTKVSVDTFGEDYPEPIKL